MQRKIKTKNKEAKEKMSIKKYIQDYKASEQRFEESLQKFHEFVEKTKVRIENRPWRELLNLNDPKLR